MKILTTHTYWSTCPIATKTYWRKVANRMPGTIVCTGRPDLREYRGNTSIRRASTGGKWGKSADIVGIDIIKLQSETAFILV